MSSEEAEVTLNLLQRQYRRRNAWYWLFVGMIPLGIILPCGLSVAAYKIWGAEVSAPIAYATPFCPLIGLAGMLLTRGARRRSRRSLEIASLADSYGLSFALEASPESLELLKNVSIMSAPQFQLGENELSGEVQGRALLALDYEYRYLLGSVSLVSKATLVVYRNGFEHLPAFSVIPISVMGQVENAILGKTNAIAFPHDPQFERMFGVVGPDPLAIQSCLAPQLVEFFKHDHLLTVLVENGQLIVFRRQTLLTADQYRAFLEQTYHLAEMLCMARPPG